MKLLVERAPLRRLLRWIQRAFSAAAVLILGYCGFVLIDAWTFQKAEARQLELLLAARQPAADAASSRTASSPSLKNWPPPVDGGLIGRIEISRLGLSVIVMEGIGRTTLRRAAGHIPGTALPGQPGNVGISGHRDTFFRPLRNVRADDIVTLTTLLGEYRYRVVSTRITAPSDTAVLGPSQNQVLTLVTCYPFYFVGSAPSRFIVRAERL
jgi:sortase A